MSKLAGRKEMERSMKPQIKKKEEKPEVDED